MLLSTWAGLPTATTFAGTSFVTTAPAPITLFSPIVTPGSTITPPCQLTHPVCTQQMSAHRGV